MTYHRMVVDPGPMRQAPCSVSPRSFFEPKRWDGERGLALGREPRRACRTGPIDGNRSCDGVDAGAAPGGLDVFGTPPGTGTWAYD